MLRAEDYNSWDDLGSDFFKLSNSLWALVPLEAWRRGLQVQLRPGARFTISGRGATHTFRQTRLSNAVQDAIARACGDKHATNQVLAAAGVPVPRGRQFLAPFDRGEIVAYAEQLGFPVCLKPNAWAKGRGVFPKVLEVETFRRLLDHLIDDLACPDILVEDHIRGNNVRVIVVGDEAVAVTRMLAAHVFGDGTSTLRELAQKRNLARKISPYLGGVPILLDEGVEQYLADQGLSLDSVPPNGEPVVLTATANISKGGDPVDITDQVSPTLKQIAVDAIRAIPNLSHGAVDLIVDEPLGAAPVAVVNEINPSAGLGPQLYPAQGQRRDVISALVDHYFPGSTRLANAEWWHFGLNAVVRLFTSETLDRAGLKPMPHLTDPQWRTVEVSCAAGDAVTARRVVMQAMSSHPVHGTVATVRPRELIVRLVGHGQHADKAVSVLRRALARENASARTTSRAPFPATPGFRTI